LLAEANDAHFMALTFTVNLRGRPLRRTYVSHFDFFRVPQTVFVRTNEAGQATIASAVSTSQIKVRVHAQNAVVRVLDGSFPISVEVSQEFTVSHGGTININTTAEQQDHFRIMASCLDVYDTVWRQFRPFNQPSRGAFPFGRGGTVAQDRERLPRIEVVYPDNSPATLAFVEPVSLTTGHPLIHLKHRSLDPRLFGTTTPPMDPTLIPHELAHALYFAIMPATTRASVEAQYLAWITSRVAAGLRPFHNTATATTPFVAWVEALGIFSERFFFFARRQTPPLTDVQLRQAFFRDELSATPLLQSTALTGYSQVATLNGSGVEPALTGDNVEGAVYGAIFVDLARRAGLRESVGQYMGSSDNSVLNFDDFRNLLINETDLDPDVIAVANTWGL
jgi:hypothetical protein